MSSRGLSVTKTAGTISRGCLHCGKGFQPGATLRKRFCDDTCRQANYRGRTGKSAYAGTVRAKTAIPERAKSGFPKALDDREWLAHESRLLLAAFRARCVGGVIEVYHHKHGRGVLDLLRPFNDCTVNHAGNLWPLSGKPKGNWEVWRQARCQFDRPKRWIFLDWKDIYLLEWHVRDGQHRLPKNLRWVHADPTRRVRRSRNTLIHVDFNRVDVHFDPKKGFVLTRESPELTGGAAALSELTEHSGEHHDPKQPQTIRLDDHNSPDRNGDSGSD